jgi:two-component system sensor histidine kinase PhoQ
VTSLRTRVLVSAAVVLTVFVLLTGLALEQAIRDAVFTAREERLQAQIFLLMAAGEQEDQGLVFPKALAESRLRLPGSGLYAKVLNALGDPVWRSPSTLGSDDPTPPPLPPGRRQFQRLQGPAGTEYLVLAFGVTWATGPVPQDYTFVVAEDAAAFANEVAEFRTSLAGWLGAMALLMLAALVAVLRWGLKPLRHVAAELAVIETGKQSQILGRYPAEIRALTDNLNALLAHERARQHRLDNTLGDLAHSLKTPLAVMRGALDDQQTSGLSGDLMREQLHRIDHIVEYQLQRARAGHQATANLAPPVAILSTAERLVAALRKVHRDKAFSATIQIPPSLQFRGVEGDLLEMLGNLLENAFKWGHGQIRLTGTADRSELVLTVEDDGPGIAEADAPRLLERGARADESAPGHGIGLAVVREISAAYGGRLELGPSPLGGLSARLHLRA